MCAAARRFERFGAPNGAGEAPKCQNAAATAERQNAPSEWSRGSNVTPDLGLRLRRVKVKALSFGFPEYRVKRVPEREFRGANAKYARAPPKRQKSARKNPNLTGKAKVNQIWFRPRPEPYFVRCSAAI